MTFDRCNHLHPLNQDIEHLSSQKISSNLLQLVSIAFPTPDNHGCDLFHYTFVLPALEFHINAFILHMYSLVSDFFHSI